MKRKGPRIILWILAAIVTVVVVGVAVTPRLRWRAQVLALHATGRIPDISLRELVAYMMPGSDQNLARLVVTPNPYAVILNVRTSADDVRAGEQHFRSECASCHGVDARGGPGAPALVDRPLATGDSDWAVFRTVRFGIPGTAMQPHPLPENDTWQIIAFFRSLDKTAKHTDTSPEIPVVQVSYEDIAHTTLPGKDWLTYSGSYQSARHSQLTQITPANVPGLATQWIHQFTAQADDIESTPLARDGLLFVTVPPNRLICIEARTGRTMWTFEQTLAYDLPGEFGKYVNRGAAMLGDKLFIGSGDARLTAVNIQTGRMVWQTVVSEEPRIYYLSSAPLVLRDQVIIGVGTRGVGRGFIASYDANTGKERWRFIAIPGEGEKGNDTWAGDSWKRGGAPTWLTGSYDPELDLLYWGIGNPKPDYDGSVRRGDNLYSDSVVALRGSTGEKVWHFQFTPADDHDWDSNQIPIIADLTADGRTDKRLLWANRNGFYYVLDRVTGKYITATPFVRQTWTAGIDPEGRPLPRPESERNAKGFLIFPGNMGGTNWWSPSYDPNRSLMFVPALEWGGVYYSSSGSWPAGQAGAPFYTAVRALDAHTGQLVWEYRQESQQSYASMGGLLSTTTGLVFGGDQQRFFALDSKTGKRLWSLETGGKIVAAPITYEVDGRQFIAVASGRTLLAFALPSAGPAVTN